MIGGLFSLYAMQGQRAANEKLEVLRNNMQQRERRRAVHASLADELHRLSQGASALRALLRIGSRDVKDEDVIAEARKVGQTLSRVLDVAASPGIGKSLQEDVQAAGRVLGPLLAKATPTSLRSFRASFTDDYDNLDALIRKAREGTIQEVLRQEQ
jgi:hypothetical protein